MDRIGMSLDDQRYLFCPIQRIKMGKGLRQSGKISYTCLRELFKKKVADLGLPPSKFGLHSLRVGGATAAANGKVPDRLGCSRGTGVGGQKVLKKVMLKITYRAGLKFLRALGCIPLL